MFSFLTKKKGNEDITNFISITDSQKSSSSSPLPSPSPPPPPPTTTTTTKTTSRKKSAIELELDDLLSTSISPRVIELLRYHSRRCTNEKSGGGNDSHGGGSSGMVSYKYQKELEKLEIEYISQCKGETLFQGELDEENEDSAFIKEKILIEKKLKEEKRKKNIYFYCKGELEALKQVKATRFLLKPTVFFDCNAEEIHFRICESQFLRFLMQNNYPQSYSLDQVEYIVNPNFVKDFNESKVSLANKHGFLLESMKPLLLFHGTSEKNMENILKTNFLVNKIGSSTDMGYYGKGFYFSEYPGTSISYSRGNPYLLLCLVLVGKAFKMQSVVTGCPLTKGYDSHISPCGGEVVIFNPKHILPCYKLKWSQNTTRDCSKYFWDSNK